MTLMCKILDHVKIDGVVVGFDSEDGIVEDDLLSGIGTVYFKYVQIHGLCLQ